MDAINPPTQPPIHPIPSSLPPHALSSTTIPLPRHLAHGVRDDCQHGHLCLYSRVRVWVSLGLERVYFFLSMVLRVKVVIEEEVRLEGLES
jgi:hypothetical protein